MDSEAVEFVCVSDPRRGNTPVKTEGPAEWKAAPAFAPESHAGICP